MNLLESQEFNTNLGNRWLLNVFTNDPSEVFDLIINLIIKRISVGALKTSNLVTVSISAHDPALAAQMLQTHLNLYLEQNLELSRQESREMSKWLKIEAEAAEKRLSDSQSKLVEFLTHYGIVSPKEGNLGQVADLMDKSFEGRIRSLNTRLRMQALKERKTENEETPLPRDLQVGHVTKLEEQLAILELEYAQLREIYDADFPKLVSLSNKIEFFRGRITQLKKQAVNSALSTASKEEALFEENLEKAKDEAGKIRELEAEYRLLGKEVEANAEVFKLLQKEYREQEIRSRAISHNARIVDTPNVPTKPSWPNKKLLIFLGAIAGFVCAAVGSVGLEILDKKIYDPREIKETLGAQRLWIIPDLGKIKMHRKGGDQRKEFMAFNFPGSIMSDAVRNIQTSLLLMHSHKRIQCVLIASPVQNQGKTLIAVSLATVLASGGKKVLLVDGDLRKPRLHCLFKKDTVAGSGGFPVLLSSKQTHIENFFTPTQIPNLHLMNALPLRKDSTSLMQSNYLPSIIDDMRTHFDYIIFDSAPLLGIPDTLFLCPHVDGIILVARQGNILRDNLRETSEILSVVNETQILGVVLSKVRSATVYGYYGKRT
jgi:polysaccharide biosynthesis transport protein